MITLPNYNWPLSFKQFVRNYFNFKASVTTTKPEISGKGIDLKKQVFLIVSDDPFTSFVFGRHIEKWNGQVDIATTEAEALENIAATQYKAILVDVKANSEGRLDEASQQLLKSVTAKKQAYSIALIEEKTDAMKADLIKAGIKDWLSKEADPDELSERLVFYNR